MQKKEYIHQLDFLVRDYECDIQGVVNNAVYQFYFEHARHQFLSENNINFFELSKEGIDLIIAKVVIEYKYSLRSRDRFVVKTNIVHTTPLRFTFFQDIFRIPDNKLIATSEITATCIVNGRPQIPLLLQEKIQQLHFSNK